MLAEAVEPTLARLLGEPPAKPVAELGRDFATSLLPVDWLERDSYHWYARHHEALAIALTLKPESNLCLLGRSGRSSRPATHAAQLFQTPEIKKTPDRLEVCLSWCPGEDSNLHEVTPAST